MDSASDKSHVNPYVQSDSDQNSNSEEELPQKTHTVKFKCVGATYDKTSQQTLAEVCQLLQKGDDIPVNIFLEPTNKYDSKAICFKCQLNGEWK